MRPARAAREVGASLRAAPAAARWARPDDACSPRATRHDPCQAAATSTMHASAAARAGTGKPSEVRARAVVVCRTSAGRPQRHRVRHAGGPAVRHLLCTRGPRPRRYERLLAVHRRLRLAQAAQGVPASSTRPPHLLLLPPRRRRSRGDGLSSLRSDLPHAVACPVTCLRARPRHTSPTATVRRAITHGVWR